MCTPKYSSGMPRLPSHEIACTARSAGQTLCSWRNLSQTALFWAPFRPQLMDCVQHKPGAVKPMCLLPGYTGAVIPGLLKSACGVPQLDILRSHFLSLQTHCELTPACCRLVTDREQHQMQWQQALLSQQLREQHAHIEQAKPLVALLVTGVAHKVPEACCCTVAGTSVVPDTGTCSRCCSSTHAREPAHGLGGVCWRPSCMRSLCRSLLISVQCGFVLLSPSMSMHDIRSSNAATSNAWLQDAGGSTRSQVVEALIK